MPYAVLCVGTTVNFHAVTGNLWVVRSSETAYGMEPSEVHYQFSYVKW